MVRTGLINRLMTGVAAAAIVAVVSVAAAPSAFAAVSEKSLRYYEKAQSYVQKGNINAAVIELKNAIRSDSDNIDARFELAKIYMAKGDAPGAEKEFRAAMSGGYDEAVIVPLLADVYLMQGKHKELLDELADVTLQGEAQAQLLVRRAQSHFVLKDDEAAREEIAKAKAIDARLPEIYVVESWLLQRSGDTKGAEDVIDTALSLSDRSAEAHLQKAELRRLRGDSESAVEFATKSLNINPYDRRARMTRSLANAALGNADAALADAETLIERNARDPFGAFIKGWSLAQQGQVSEALAALDQGQGVEQFEPALYLAASLHLTAGQFEQARAKIEKYLIRAPGSKRGQLVSAAIAYRSGDYERAVEVLEALYARYKTDGQVVAMLASAYDQVGDQAKAAALYDEATALSPEDENLQFLSARAKIGSGDVAGGVDDLTGLIDSATGGERAATVIFLMHLREKDFDQAEIALAKLEGLTGETRETENYRASLALAQTDLAVAEGHLNRSLELDERFQAARLNLGRVKRANKDIDGARAEYETLLSQYPGYLPALAGLIQLAEDADNQNEAERLYHMGADLNPQSDQAHLRLINHHIRSGQIQKGRTAAQVYGEAKPASGLPVDALARVQLAGGDHEGAISSYQKLTRMFPDNTDAHFRLAKAQIADEAFSDAIFALDRVVTLSADHAEAIGLRISLEARVYDEERALSKAERLYADYSENMAHKIALGQARLQYGEEERGLQLLQEAFEAEKSRAGLVALYAAYDQLGQSDAATAILENWVRSNPSEMGMRTALFSRHISAGRHDEAIVEGEALYNTDAKNVIVLNNLAWLYETKGRVAEALDLSRTAHELAPQSGEIADTYGWILFEHGDAVEAERVLSEAAELLPDNPTVQYHHAAALAKTGNAKAALEKLKAALSDPAEFDGRTEAVQLLGELE